MASSPGSRTAGFIASPPAVSKPCGLPFASIVSTFPALSGKPKLHETSSLMSIPGEELHIHRRQGCQRFGRRRRSQRGGGEKDDVPVHAPVIRPSQLRRI